MKGGAAPHRGRSASGVAREEELARTESKAVLAQYDAHVEQMSKELREKAESQSDNLEKKLAEKRALMKERLLAMEQMLDKAGMKEPGQTLVKTKSSPRPLPKATGGGSPVSIQPRFTVQGI